MQLCMSTVTDQSMFGNVDINLQDKCIVNRDILIRSSYLKSSDMAIIT